MLGYGVLCGYSQIVRPISTDGPGAIVDGEKLPQVGSSQANGNEVLRTRSRRAVVQLKSSATSGNFLHDSDPYRKVDKLQKKILSFFLVLCFSFWDQQWELDIFVLLNTLSKQTTVDKYLV